MKFKFSIYQGLAAFALLAGMPLQSGQVDFNRDIRPILSNNCFTCHGPDQAHRKAGLRLDIREDALADLGGHAAIAPGRPEESAAYLRMTASDPNEAMPPPDAIKRPSSEQIELIKRWIEQGASWAEHWAYVVPERVRPPAVHDAEWPRNWIDRFVLARLESKGLQPSSEADRVTLLRRLSFDLIGLPPAIEEVEAFVHDRRPNAYERAVDRLLASPHYGERMAVYWLDLVRYADTVGYHGDQEHHISPYRDWVIDAFNGNMPFDRFTLEQLAGDLLPEPGIDQKIATGYNRLLQTSHEGGIQDKEYLAKYSADRVRNVSSVWMGATMACAECHDHKYDPYSIKDFYSLAAFFADIEQKGDYGGPNTSPSKRPPEIQVLTPAERARIARVDALIAELSAGLDSETELAAGKKQNEIEELTQRREAIKKRARWTMITVPVEPLTVRVLPRGDWLDESGEVVHPDVPRFLKPLDVNGRRATRLDLAQWLTAPDHPLTARVFVNRLWYLFFGTGLSKVLDDFGAQGEWPEHIELLDALAVEFVRSGWDIQHMIKLIVTSGAYRQSSLASPELRRLDPDNRLIARQSRWRLPAEFIRDNALKVSGLLVTEIGGPSARPYQPDGYYAHLNFPTRVYQPSIGPGQYRRGVYTHWQRMFLHPAMLAFDAPKREECIAERPISNTPQAALTLLNDPSYVEAARVLARQIRDEGGSSPGERIAYAFRRALSRPPEPGEHQLLQALLNEHLAEFEEDPEGARALLGVGLAPLPGGGLAELAAWTSIARVLLNLNETITRN